MAEVPRVAQVVLKLIVPLLPQTPKPLGLQVRSAHVGQVVLLF